MAKTPSARELRKKKMVRIIAIVACAALLITAVAPYLATAFYRSKEIRRFPFREGGVFVYSYSK